MSSVMRRVSVRNLVAHKVRLLLTLTSVVLGTAFVAGSFIFTDTLKHSFTAIFGDAYRASPPTCSPSTTSTPACRSRSPTASPASRACGRCNPTSRRRSPSIDPKGHRIDTGGAPSVASMWIDPANSITKPPTFDSGHAPQRAGDVVINSGAADKANLRVGDHVKVVLSNVQAVPLTITGIYRTDVQTGGYIGALLSRDQAINLLTDGKHYASVDLAANRGVSEQQLTDRIAKLLPSDLEAQTGDKLRSDTNKAILSALSFINYVLLAFGFIALIVGTFIIYNTFSMIVAQRLRELALLRADRREPDPGAPLGAARGRDHRRRRQRSRRRRRRRARVRVAHPARRAQRRVAVRLDGAGRADGDRRGCGRYRRHAAVGIRAGAPRVLDPSGRRDARGVRHTDRGRHPAAQHHRRGLPRRRGRRDRARRYVLLGRQRRGTHGARARRSSASGRYCCRPLLSGLGDPPARPRHRTAVRPVGTLARTNAVRNPRRTAATAFALTWACCSSPASPCSVRRSRPASTRCSTTT